MRHPDETAQQPAGLRHEDQRHSNFAHNERVAEPLRAPAPREVPPRRAKGILLARTREAQRRHETEHDRGEHADTGRKEQHAHIDSDRRRAREPGGQQGQERPHASVRDQRTERRASCAEHATFDEELRCQRPGAGAQCSAHRHFPAPADATREKEMGDVGAGDQQQQAHGAEQHAQRPLNVAGRRVTQRTHRQFGDFPILGVLLRERLGALVRDEGGFLLCQGNRCVGAEASSHLEHPVATVRHVVGRGIKRPPEVYRRACDRLWHDEAPVENADDRDRRAIDADRASEHGSVAAEDPQPESVGEHGRVR